jgi:hypothetical protein
MLSTILFSLPIIMSTITIIVYRLIIIEKINDNEDARLQNPTFAKASSQILCRPSPKNRKLRKDDNAKEEIQDRYSLNVNRSWKRRSGVECPSL